MKPKDTRALIERLRAAAWVKSVTPPRVDYVAVDERDRDAAIAALEATLPRPIAEAPKNRILAADRHGVIAVVWWEKAVNYDGDPGWTDGTVANWGMEECSVVIPTVWWPLPEMDD